MKLKSWLTIPLLFAPVLIALSGCRSNNRQDIVIATAANPSHTLRATVIMRQYFIEGKADTSPTTYVLLDKDSGKPAYENGANFPDDQVIIKPSQCGPLNVQWSGDRVLRIICEKCGIALSAVGPHPAGVGSIQVRYEGFPDRSSWETGGGSN